MKLSISLLATLALAAGCKTDGESSKANGAAPEAEQSANKGRSGKIDLPQPRRPATGDDTARPALPEGDSPLSDDERAARREERRKERMAELDKDGDGVISDAEREAGRKARMDEMKNRLDTNGDGKLTVEELQNSRMSRRFGDVSAIDTDKNGEISAEELQKQMETMRAQGWGRRGGGPGGPGGWRGRGGDDGEATPPPAAPETK